MEKNKPIFRPCIKCKNGWIYSRNSHNELQVKQCNCYKSYLNKLRVWVKMKETNIPESALDYSIKSYIGPDEENNIKRLQYVIENFENKFYNRVLYLYGDPGTQKTTLSFWIGIELLEKNISIHYTLMNDLIKDLQNDSFQEEDLESKYYNCDCLIIDRAFHKDQVTLYKSGYQIPFLDNFLRKRIDEFQKSTIIVSNTTIKNIEKNGFNSDIQDLIYRKVVPYKLLFHFKDHYSLKDDFNSLDLWGDC